MTDEELKTLCDLAEVMGFTVSKHATAPGYMLSVPDYEGAWYLGKSYPFQSELADLQSYRAGAELVRSKRK